MPVIPPASTGPGARTPPDMNFLAKSSTCSLQNVPHSIRQVLWRAAVSGACRGCGGECLTTAVDVTDARNSKNHPFRFVSANPARGAQEAPAYLRAAPPFR